MINLPGSPDRVGLMALGSDGSLYLTGTTNSTDFPTTAGAFDTTHNGGFDAFVVKNVFLSPPPNAPPVANDDVYEVNEDGTLVVDAAGGVLANDIDADGDALTVTEVNGEADDVHQTITLPSGAELTLNSDGSFTYDPAGAFEDLAVGESDSDTFTYTMSDGTTSATATVEITILGVNDDPVANDDANATDEDTPVGGDVRANDTDVDASDLLEVSEVEGDSLNVGARPVLLPSGAFVTVESDGSYLYEPNGAFEHLGDGDMDTDSFTYTVTDGNGGTSTATVTITITGVNDDPVANEDVYEVNEDGTLVVGAASGVLANDSDADGDTLTVTEVNDEAGDVDQTITLPSGAELTLNANGSFTYTPFADFIGFDTFTYQVSDGKGGLATAIMVTINVLSTQQQIDNAISAVDALVAAGILNNGQGNSLSSKLDNAANKLDQGKTNPGINQLEALINQLEAFINAGILDDDEGEDLINQILSAIASAG